MPPLSTMAFAAPERGIAVSAVLSIHNRSVLFRRALDGYLWQTLPRERWEIVLVDDMSTEDLHEAYRHVIGRINLRHIRIDHTRHAIFQQRNPGWEPGRPADWYHTPAITINAGVAAAKGGLVCLCHPEVLHAPTNFELAVAKLRRQNAFLFGTTYLGTPETNARLASEPDWTARGWRGFLGWANAASMGYYGPECYWYTSFLPRMAVEAVGGVDFEFLNGAAGEDDDFRERVRRAGWTPLYVPEIEGLHQDHSHENEPHRRRDTEAWARGLERNRSVLAERARGDRYPFPANAWTDWSARDCVVDEAIWSIGASKPEVHQGAASGARV